MKKELKDQIIESTSALLAEYPNFYITDISGLNAGQTYELRRQCFEAGVKLVVVKNTLFKIALAKCGKEELSELNTTLEGNTAIMYTTVPNAPGKIIKGLQGKGWATPQLKGAYVQECIFVGADKLGELAAIKTKEELIGDIIMLLKSPIQRIVSALENKENAVAPTAEAASATEAAPAEEAPTAETPAAE